MKYILLEDVQKILKESTYALPLNSEKREMIDRLDIKINSLPSIDPQEMIREMIDKLYKEWDENLKWKNDHTLKKVLLSKIIATEWLLDKLTK